MKAAIIGAGPAGLTAAYQLAKAGITVDIYESSGNTGGLARTIELWGMKADIGPHRFFSYDARINSLWLEVVGNDYEMVDRLTRIYYQGKFFHYPLKPFNALRLLGVPEAIRCLLSFAGQNINSDPDNGSFESWVTQRFGKRLYEIFFKTYSEKLWGIPCSELDDDFAAQRIKKLSLSEAIKNAVGTFTANTHKSLADSFPYPKGGTGIVYERMATYIQGKGSRIFFHTPVKEVSIHAGSVTGIISTDGQFKPYDHVISTMPLNQLVAGMQEVPEEIKKAASSLTFRNAIMVYLLADGVNLFPDNWLYIHSPSLLTGRITNFRNWVPQLYGNNKQTILMLEYWCFENDDFWHKSNEELISLAKDELKKTGLAGNHPISAGQVLRISKCYPVYKIGYKSVLKPVEQFLTGIQNLQVIGRFGAFKYNNQDHSMLMGILAAENITWNKKHDLWAINTDYDDYQERSVITGRNMQTGT